MQGYQLEFFTEQDKRHGHQALYQWLLESARRIGIRGATVFMASEGYGLHRHMHSAHFFELGDQPVVITMVVTEEEAEQLFEFLHAEQAHFFYVKYAVEFGSTGPQLH